MIAARDISAAYGFTGVGFELPASGLVALVGPNGSGKTTLIKALAGLLPIEGKLTIPGHCAYLPQQLEFLPVMTVRDVVALGRVPGLGRLGRLSEEDRAIVRDAMATTHTHGFADRPVGELSGGERARVGLARALAVQAPLLLADEPTASLDASAALDIMSVLKAQSRDGLVVCAIHDLALAHHFADRVLVMQEGRIAADGKANLLEGPIVKDVFGISPPPGGWQIPQRASMRGA